MGVTPVDGVRDAFPLAAADDARWRHRPAPGTVQQDNGLDTLVVGLLVEKVTGNSFREELDRRILRPLRLRHTSLPASGDVSIPAPPTPGCASGRTRPSGRARIRGPRAG
ncbi:hypothetical protein SNE510_28430 [Streptomyces sp. NE5-10]|nr:hypothetical protein SNE510_28430 [Streptomyces sp. NE5-10]